jgi:hypothetical protein
VILAPTEVRQVLAGKKTQARRRAAGDAPCAYVPGHDYPLERLKSPSELDELERARIARPVRPNAQARPPRIAVARIVVTEVRREPLGEISLADANREGHRTTDAFRADWVARHDRRWLAGLGADPDPAALVARFHERHAAADVWAIGFELDRSAAPRLLAARGERGYVDRRFDRNGRRIALAEEPEAVDERTQERLTAEARERRRAFLAERAAERSLLSLELRLRHARERAARQRVDVSGDLRVIAARVAEIERKLDGAS